MRTHADKTLENKSQSVANTVFQKQTGGESTFRVENNRPEAIAQRKLQEMVNKGPQAKQITQLQVMTNNYFIQRKNPIQKKENNTGLPDNLKSGIEQLSGYSMDDVKVHYNSDKPAQLQAHAYAQGTEIHIGTGQEKHLPHEAWHVVQQKQGRVKPTMQMKGKVNVNDDNDLEKEADVMGAKSVGIVDNGSSFISQEKQHDKANHINSNYELVNTQLKTASSVQEDSNQSNTVIQLAKLNLRKDGTISGVSQFPNRPASNIRGSQGQHLTAYVVFEDMIRSRVKDRTVKNAAAELKKILNEISALPGMKVKSGAYLIQYMERAASILDKNDTDPTTVGEVIDEILSIRNKVPGTAERGTGGGHGEAKHSGILETVETALRTDSWKDTWDEDVVSEQCRYGVWRLLDYNPSNPSNDDERKEIAIKIVTHFKSIISAYPKTESWLGSRNDYFTTYMKAHRDDVGMPLSKVKPTELEAIFNLMDSIW